MFRLFIYYIVLVIITVIGGSGAAIVGLFNPYSPIIHGFIMQTWSKIILRVTNTNVVRKGLDHITPKKSYIVICNHQSNLDIPVLVANLPLLVTFIAKKELFKIPFFGWGLKGAGMIKVDRSNTKQAIDSLKKAEKNIIDNKLSVIAFPEGTRSHDGEIHPFKKGPFIFAMNTGIPILPVSLKGTFNILPREKLLLKKGDVILQIYTPIEVKNYSFQDRNALIKHVQNIISEGFYGSAKTV
jgi:1-acyl-sn-glycerol-3-phosphate acyltransferase